jgi:quercetin dioxygenase-like cupin family protein
MPVRVEKWDPAWGRLNEQSLRRRFEQQGYTVSCYAYPPGTYFPDHTHEVDKKDSVLAGELQIVAEGQEFLLRAGDTIEIPAGTVHNAKVIGEEEVVSLDATRLRPKGSGGQARPRPA